MFLFAVLHLWGRFRRKCLCNLSPGLIENEARSSAWRVCLVAGEHSLKQWYRVNTVYTLELLFLSSVGEHESGRVQ